MRIPVAAAMLCVCTCIPSFADAPKTSPRPHDAPDAIASASAVDVTTIKPRLRPEVHQAVPQETVVVIQDASDDTPHPKLRPAETAVVAATGPDGIAVAVAAAGDETLRPKLRPSEADIAAAPDAIAVAVASADDQTPRPRLRPGSDAAGHATLSTQAAAVPLVIAGLDSVPFPKPRPALKPKADQDDGADAKAAAVQPESDDAPSGGLEKVQTVAAIRILPGKQGIFGRKGSVCGNPAIKGEEIAPITSRVRGCGIDDPVKITSVSGVALSTPATIDCNTAVALNDWVSDDLQPNFAKNPVVQLTVMGSYSCRTRDNIKGAKLSEHAKGHAIDIGGLTLANGTTLNVARDWYKPVAKPMKAAYKAACGTFGTTLSPDADRYHKDHMHLDTARYRSPYCR